jgi:hypothetical protein
MRILQASHLLLNLSWDELRTAICSLCSLIPSDREACIISGLGFATTSVFSIDELLWDLTCGSLRLMWQTVKWTYFLRECSDFCPIHGPP